MQKVEPQDQPSTQRQNPPMNDRSLVKEYYTGISARWIDLSRSRVNGQTVQATILDRIVVSRPMALPGRLPANYNLNKSRSYSTIALSDGEEFDLLVIQPAIELKR